MTFPQKAIQQLTVLIFIVFAFSVQANAAEPSLKFTVSMQDPATHYYHVELRCEGFAKDKMNFKLPAWTPGYYWIMDFAKNVVRFNAETSTGKTLSWDKVDKNNWEVNTEKAGVVMISYDVFANTQSVADPFIDESHAYISPAGVFMHTEGYLKTAVTVKLKPYSKWAVISTGLEQVAGATDTFSATDFDVLYDSPFYIGNQKTMSFDVKGIRHVVAMENPAIFDTVRLVGDLKKMVSAATDLMGHIPYKDYTFIIMGPGNGGLEHRNSTAVFSSARYTMDTKGSYNSWLSFLAHEYFHLYNIKAIRPVALGPFNYDKENLTHMLWVSEGFTVYYEYAVLNRSGLLSREELLNAITGDITKFENVAGHQLQSASASSYDTWIQFFNKNENAANTTISYYDKGCVLGFLLDLKIRNETKNRKSLDDVMRKLYKEFYQEKKRGFTDVEFRQVCEAVAGTSLEEIFSYAATVKDIDYPKYLAYAGLTIDLKPLSAQDDSTTGKVIRRSFKISEMKDQSPLQKVILESIAK
jgi:predicted metalloprotease with PDZ domain